MYKRHLVLSGSLILLQTIYASSFAQNDCGAVSIDSAEYRYEIGRFEENIERLSNCLNIKHGFTPDQKAHAYQLLAKCYLAIDSTNKADSVIEELLLLKDNFETDPRDEERFRNRVLFRRSNIVSSVSKRSEDIRLAPATVITITHEEIIQRGYTDLIDLLKDLPGFDIATYYGQQYANVYQRGFRNDNSEKTLLLVDGVEENDLWSNSMDISQQYPVTNIKRVEVIYGPASTMYGPNAYSGVINIITKDPVDYLKGKRSFGINANAGIGSYNTKYADVSTAYKKGIFSFSATGRVYYSDRPDLSGEKEWSYDTSSYDEYIPSTFRYRQILAAAPGTNAKEYLIENNLPPETDLYRPKPDNTMLIKNPATERAEELNKALFDKSKDTLGFTQFTNPAQSYYVSTKINIGDLGLGFASWSKKEGIGTTFTDLTASASGSRWKPAHHYIYLNYNKRLNNKLLFTALLNYKIHTIKNGSKITSVKSYSFWGGLELKDLYDNVPSSWLTTYYFEQSKQFRSELRLLYNQSKYFYLISGIELRNGQLQNYYLTDTTSSVPEDHGTHPDSLQGGNHSNVNDIGVYTQGSYRFKNGLGFTLGGRVDYNQIRHGGGLGYQFNPRFVIDYVTKGWVFKAIASKGIQNISNFTKFDNLLVKPNDSLTAEKIYNYEISASNKISNAFTADIELFYSNVKDVVSLYQENRVVQNTNNGEYKIKGIQANLYFKLPDKKWQASLNYTYANSKRTRGVNIPLNDGNDSSNSIIATETVTVAGIAPHKINGVVNFIILKNFNINLRTNYVSSRKAGRGTTLPFNRDTAFNGYFIENIAIGAQNLIKGTTIQFICNNIFDKEYYSPGIRYGGGVRYPNSILQMGRNFFIKINYEL